MGELLSKNIVRTARRHLNGGRRLFGEYLRSCTTLKRVSLQFDCRNSLIPANFAFIFLHNTVSRKLAD